MRYLKEFFMWMGIAFISMLFIGPYGPVTVFVVWLTLFIVKRNDRKRVRSQ